MTGYEPYDVQHEAYEFETRYSRRAHPPQYDIAFKLNEDERVMWPLEAKVLKTDSSIAEYVADVQGQFVTCRYAPFSSEGAMLGYLLSGQTGSAFRNIAARLNCEVVKHPAFMDRAHRVSRHVRTVPIGKTYPGNFTCHHLIMVFFSADNTRAEE